MPKVGNHRSSSDAAVEFLKIDENSQEQVDLQNKIVVAIKEKQIPNNNSHPLRPTDIIRSINKETGQNKNMWWHTQMYKKYQVRSSKASCKTIYCNYHIASNRYSYIQEWVEFLIKQENLLQN